MRKFNENKNKSEKEKNESPKFPSKQTLSPNQSVITKSSSQNNFIVKEVAISSSNLDKREKEPRDESGNTVSGMEEIRQFYRFRNATCIKFEEAQLAAENAKKAESELAEERTRVQITMELNERRQGWRRSTRSTLTRLINRGDVEKISEWVKVDKNEPLENPNVDTIAKAIAIKDKGILCELLSGADVDCNTTTSW